MEIRRATEGDLPGLTALWQERMVILSQCDPRVKLALADRDSWLLQIGERIAGGNSAVVVAEKETSLAGYIVGYTLSNAQSKSSRKYGVVEEIALDSHAYHGGLARSLLSALSTWFSASNVVQIVIHTPRYFPVEQAFWRGLGAVVWTPPSQETAAWQIPPEYLWLTM